MANLVIIPTYNEKENINRLVKAISSLPVPFDILVIDDNSPDGTGTLVKEMMPAFPRAQARGMGLIVKVPLDSGWLSGRYRGNSRFNDVRKRWSPEVIARRGALVEKFAELVPPGMPMAHAALQYCLAQPEVSSVIPGPKTVAQALDNFAAADKELSAETVQAMRDLWKNEIESDPLPW